jgi:hypothetical protein
MDRSGMQKSLTPWVLWLCQGIYVGWEAYASGWIEVDLKDRILVVAYPVIMGAVWAVQRYVPRVPLRPYSRHIRLASLCVALAAAAWVLEPYRLHVALVAIAYLCYREAFRLNKGVAGAGPTLADGPQARRTAIVDDTLCSSAFDQNTWRVTEGVPQMVSATERGMRLRWEGNRSYTRSGQLSTDLPDAHRWVIEADMTCVAYASGWNPGIYIYGTDEFPALLGIGFMPGGSPVPPPAEAPLIPQFDGLAIQTGEPGRPDSMTPLDKCPVPMGREVHVRVVRRVQRVTVIVDSRWIWKGEIAGRPTTLCLGAFRWPIKEGEAPNRFPPAECFIRNLRVTTRG